MGTSDINKTQKVELPRALPGAVYMPYVYMDFLIQELSKVSEDKIINRDPNNDESKKFKFKIKLVQKIARLGEYRCNSDSVLFHDYKGASGLSYDHIPGSQKSRNIKADLISVEIYPISAFSDESLEFFKGYELLPFVTVFECTNFRGAVVDGIVINKFFSKSLGTHSKE